MPQWLFIPKLYGGFDGRTVSINSLLLIRARVCTVFKTRVSDRDNAVDNSVASTHEHARWR